MHVVLIFVKDRKHESVIFFFRVWLPNSLSTICCGSLWSVSDLKPATDQPVLRQAQPEECQRSQQLHWLLPEFWSQLVAKMLRCASPEPELLTFHWRSSQPGLTKQKWSHLWLIKAQLLSSFYSVQKRHPWKSDTRLPFFRSFSLPPNLWTIKLEIFLSNMLQISPTAGNIG